MTFTEKIENVLNDNPGVVFTLGELVKKTRVQRSTVRGILSRLVQAKTVRRVEQGRYTGKTRLTGTLRAPGRPRKDPSQCVRPPDEAEKRRRQKTVATLGYDQGEAYCTTCQGVTQHSAPYVSDIFDHTTAAYCTLCFSFNPPHTRNTKERSARLQGGTLIPQPGAARIPVPSSPSRASSNGHITVTVDGRRISGAPADIRKILGL